jgi:signal peptidase II
MQLTRLHNTGAAWSSFSGMTAVLAVVTVVLMALVLWLLIKKIVRHPLGVAGCLLILGGGMGNLIDRIFRGYVVDMFDLLLFQYPIFNLADCFVVVGAVLGAIYYLFLYEKTDRREKPHDPDADGHK